MRWAVTCSVILSQASNGVQGSVICPSYATGVFATFVTDDVRGGVALPLSLVLFGVVADDLVVAQDGLRLTRCMDLVGTWRGSPHGAR